MSLCRSDPILKAGAAADRKVLLPDPVDGLSDITELYLAQFHLLPAGQRGFIRALQQINGWRDLPKTALRPHPGPIVRAPPPAGARSAALQPFTESAYLRSIPY